jgi:hypothetical protein
VPTTGEVEDLDNTQGSTDVPLEQFLGLDTELAPQDIPSGVSPDCQDVAFLPGSVRTRPGLSTLYNTPLPNNVSVNYAKSFIQANGNVLTLFLGGDGRLYSEDTTNNPGNYLSIGTASASLVANSFTAFGKEFLSFHDGFHGQEITRQYDGIFLDRVSQDGPAANPTQAVDLAQTVTLQIVSQGTPSCSSITEVGNICTAEFSPSGIPVAHGFFVGQQITVNQVFSGTGVELMGYEGVFIIASVPTPHTLTFVNPTTGLGAAVQGNFFLGSAALIANSPTGATEVGGVCTITTLIPHGLNVNEIAAVQGVTVSGYNGSFPVASVLNPTQFTYVNSTTGLAASGTGGVSSLLANLTTVQPHGMIAGDPFIITGQTGGATWANGNWTVLAVISPNELTFTAATGFTLNLGTTAAPVTTGGQITGGVHQYVVMFLTRNALITPPSPVASWTCGGGKQVQISGIPIGPANTTARILAFTPTGGDNYFYIPITVTGANSTIIPDNVTTTAQFNFSDNTLMSSEAIDVDGNNLFNQVPLGPNGGGFIYADRTLWWGERNKVQNLVNMGFDGGSLSGVMLGWTIVGTGGQLVTTGDFGGAWQITGDGSAFTTAVETGGSFDGPLTGGSGLIQQSAFQDQDGINILQPNSSYTFVCYASVPVLLSQGNIVCTLSSAATPFLSTATIPCNSLTVNGGFVQGVFSVNTPITIPSDLLLSVSTQNTVDGAVVTIDETELVPTSQPFADTQIRCSYTINPEAFDNVSGLISVGRTNGEPIRRLFTLHDTLYIVKSNSIYATTDNGQEPATWQVATVSSAVGALSNRAVDVGDSWAYIAARGGLYLFNGGDPVKISQEIQSLWDRINWSAAQTVWVKIDPLIKRVYISVPLDDAISPNVLLVLDDRELNTASDIQAGAPIHISYTGKMISSDLTRKWTVWNSPTGSNQHSRWLYGHD